MSTPLGAVVSSSRTELPPRAASRSARPGRSVVGGFLLSMGGVHLARRDWPRLAGQENV